MEGCGQSTKSMVSHNKKQHVTRQTFKFFPRALSQSIAHPELFFNHESKKMKSTPLFRLPR